MPGAAAATNRSEALSCSLPAAELLDRLAAWNALAQEALSRSAEPGRVVSTYPRSEALAARLQELIDSEARCCPFLVFDVRETDEVIEAELRYPPEFEPIVSMIAPTR